MTNTNTTEKLQVKTATPGAKFAPGAPRKKVAKRRHGKAAAKPAIGPKPAAQERMSLGRPSKYRAEMCEAMRAYFNIPVETRRFPTFARFAGTVGVTRVTLRRWATATNADGTEKYPDFAFEYEYARTCQCALLQEGMFGGFYDVGFAIAMLKRLFGWQD